MPGFLIGRGLIQGRFSANNPSYLLPQQQAI